MTKAQLIEELAQTTGLSKADCDRNLEAVLSVIGQAIEKGERLDLRGFGTFRLRQTKARLGRNPRTGATLNIAAKKVPVFKPSKELAERLNPASPTSESAPQ